MSCFPGRCGSLHDDPGFGGGRRKSRGKGEDPFLLVCSLTAISWAPVGWKRHLASCRCPHCTDKSDSQCPQFLSPLVHLVCLDSFGCCNVWPALLPDSSRDCLLLEEFTPSLSLRVAKWRDAWVSAECRRQWTLVWRQLQMHKERRRYTFKCFVRKIITHSHKTSL